jgi:hypothetical protein
VMYNNSTFHDFTKSVADGGLVQGAIGPTKEGNAGFYLLTDQQLWQSAPDSASTVSRGLYAGATLHDVGTYGKPETWSATFGYLARLRPGVSLPLASITRRILHRRFTLVLRRQIPRSVSKEMH